MKRHELYTASYLRKEFEIRVFDESFNRIRKCLYMINETDLWRAPNSQINSTGVLIEHLIGNATQWICAGLGQESDARVRDNEFVIHPERTIKSMISKIDECEVQLRQTIALLTEEIVGKNYRIQGIESTGFSVVVHVIEHISYHVGQITFLTKFYSEKQTNYYSDMDLNLSVE